MPTETTITFRRRSVFERWAIRYLIAHGWSPRFAPSGYVMALIEDVQNV